MQAAKKSKRGRGADVKPVVLSMLERVGKEI
jgi:hypothetical protein